MRHRTKYAVPAANTHGRRPRDALDVIEVSPDNNGEVGPFPSINPVQVRRQQHWDHATKSKGRTRRNARMNSDASPPSPWLVLLAGPVLRVVGAPKMERRSNLKLPLHSRVSTIRTSKTSGCTHDSYCTLTLKLAKSSDRCWRCYIRWGLRSGWVPTPAGRDNQQTSRCWRGVNKPTPQVGKLRRPPWRISNRESSHKRSGPESTLCVNGGVDVWETLMAWEGGNDSVFRTLLLPFG